MNVSQDPVFGGRGRRSMSQPSPATSGRSKSKRKKNDDESMVSSYESFFFVLGVIGSLSAELGIVRRWWQLGIIQQSVKKAAQNAQKERLFAQAGDGRLCHHDGLVQQVPRSGVRWVHDQGRTYQVRTNRRSTHWLLTVKINTFISTELLSRWQIVTWEDPPLERNTTVVGAQAPHWKEKVSRLSPMLCTNVSMNDKKLHLW